MYRISNDGDLATQQWIMSSVLTWESEVTKINWGKAMDYINKWEWPQWLPCKKIDNFLMGNTSVSPLQGPGRAYTVYKTLF